MAHQEQRDFCLSVKEKFPYFFSSKFVLDVGSLDINGNNQYLFDNCGYLGVDLLPGKNIDIISKAHELKMPDCCFDVIISTECLEHDPYYVDTLKNIYRMLKPGGLLLFSCATKGRPEHGTRRTTPSDAPFIHNFGEWGDYYRNLEEADIRAGIDVDLWFKEYEFSEQHKTHDLYFWGIKSGILDVRTDYSFLLSDNPYIREIKRLELIVDGLKKAEAKSQKELILYGLEMEELKTKLAACDLELQEVLAWIEENYDIERNRLINTPKVDEFIEVIDQSIPLSGESQFKSESGGRGNLYCNNKKWGIMTPGHTNYVAFLLAERLKAHGFFVEIFNKSPDFFDNDFYIVICPQVYDRLPPPNKRICYQMEQSVSSRWFNDKYFDILRNSFAVLDYSSENIKFLKKNGIEERILSYLPIGASCGYGAQIDGASKRYSVLFYGDNMSSPRRLWMLNALEPKFDVKIINNLFGVDMMKAIKQAEVVLNIHYYDNALLEMPRIQECLSLGVQVVSEAARDQNDYPEIVDAVRFFEQGSIDGMISAIQKSLLQPLDIKNSVVSSNLKFSCIFDQFLENMDFI